MNYPNRIGRFCGVVLQHGFTESKGNAVMYRIKAGLDYEFDPRVEGDNPWADIAAEDMVVDCDICLVTKEGQLNESGVRQLKETFAWDGDWNGLRSADLVNQQIQVQIKSEVYQEKERFKASWIYPGTADPSQMIGAIQDDQFAALAARHGAGTKALVGGTVQPAGRPARPGRPAPQGAQQAPPAAQQAPQAQQSAQEAQERPPFDSSKAAGAPGAAPRRRPGRPPNARQAEPAQEEMPPAKEDDVPPWASKQS